MIFYINSLILLEGCRVYCTNYILPPAAGAPTRHRRGNTIVDRPDMLCMYSMYVYVYVYMYMIYQHHRVCFIIRSPFTPSKFNPTPSLPPFSFYIKSLPRYHVAFPRKNSLKYIVHIYNLLKRKTYIIGIIRITTSPHVSKQIPLPTPPPPANSGR